MGMLPQKITAEEHPTYQTYLEEAIAARHRLITGEQAVSVSYEGESVSYQNASLPKLNLYIRELQRLLGKPTAKNVGGVRFRPVRFGRSFR